LHNLGEDEEKQMLQSSNRVFYNPMVVTYPWIIAGTLLMAYGSGFFFPHAVAATHGLFTGGFIGGLLVRTFDPLQKDLDIFVDKLLKDFDITFPEES
jgi:hypothetical protein